MRLLDLFEDGLGILALAGLDELREAIDCYGSSPYALA
jgi:hypothetical protein